MVENKQTSVISHSMEITEHKLNGINYLDWSRTIQNHLLSNEMANHIDEDPPKEDVERKRWDRIDARLYNRITNSMNDEIVDPVSHCTTMK